MQSRGKMSFTVYVCEILLTIIMLHLKLCYHVYSNIYFCIKFFFSISALKSSYGHKLITKYFLFWSCTVYDTLFFVASVAQTFSRMVFISTGTNLRNIVTSYFFRTFFFFCFNFPKYTWLIYTTFTVKS